MHRSVEFEKKTLRKDCPAHCYAPVMREKIRDVMRYSGPRMLYRHPVMALRHLLNQWHGRRIQRTEAAE